MCSAKAIVVAAVEDAYIEVAAQSALTKSVMVAEPVDAQPFAFDTAPSGQRYITAVPDTWRGDAACLHAGDKLKSVNNIGMDQLKDRELVSLLKTKDLAFVVVPVDEQDAAGIKEGADLRTKRADIAAQQLQMERLETQEAQQRDLAEQQAAQQAVLQQQLQEHEAKLEAQRLEHQAALKAQQAQMQASLHAQEQEAQAHQAKLAAEVQEAARQQAVAEQPPATQENELSLVLARPDFTQGLGFGMGTHENGEKFVTTVTPGGPADGILQPGDGLLFIDGADAQSLAHEDAAKIMSKALSLPLRVKREPKESNWKTVQRIVMPGGIVYKITVRLSRASEEESFGFGLGSAVSGEKVITQITDQNEALDQLAVADKVLAINGHDAEAMSFEDSIGLISSGLAVDLTVERRLNTLSRRFSISKVAPDTKIAERRDNVGKTVDLLEGLSTEVPVTLKRDSTAVSYGFGLGSSDSGEKVVTNVAAGGLAEGQLQVADAVVEVNGVDIARMAHHDIVALMAGGTALVLTIARRIPMDVIRRGESITQVAPDTRIMQRMSRIGLPAGNERFTVLLERPDLKTSFGFGVETAFNEKFIKNIVPGGLASSAEPVALQDLDRILGINGRCVKSMTHEQAVAYLRAEKVELGIEREHSRRQPGADNVLAMVEFARPSTEVSFGFNFTYDSVLSPQTGATQDCMYVSDITPFSPASNHLCSGDLIKMINGRNAQELERGEAEAEIMSGVNISLSIERDPNSAPTPSFMVEIVRESMHQSFGFGIQTLTFGDKIITNVNPDGVSAGKLDAGDEVIRVNEVDISPLDHAEVARTITSQLVLRLAIKRKTATAVRKTATAVPLPDVPVQAVVNVRLQREAPNQSWGFELGSIADSNEQVVTRNQEDGISDGKLQQGDIIVGINGQPCRHVGHEEVVAAIKASTTTLDLTVERHSQQPQQVAVQPAQVQPPTPVQQQQAPLSVQPEVEQLMVVISREFGTHGSFGFELGSTEEGFKIVSNVVADGSADKKLAPKDRLLSVNGQDVSALSHEETIRLISSSKSVEVGLARIVEPKPTAEIALGVGEPEHIAVDITREGPNDSFGFSLGTGVNGEKVVTKISPSGVAEGKLATLDLILNINGHDARSLSHDEAIQVMCQGLDLDLLVERRSRQGESNLQRRGSITTVAPDRKIFKRRNSIGKGSIEVPAGVALRVPVNLDREHTGASYGFGLGTGMNGEQLITNVKEGGVADGKLQPSDMILEISGHSATSLSHNDAMNLMCEGTTLALVVERRQSLNQTQRRASIGTVEPGRRVMQRRNSIGKVEGGEVILPAGDLDRQTLTVSRPHLEASYGFGVGTTEDGTKVVTEISDGCTTPLQTTDTIASIDGMDATAMTHQGFLEHMISATEVELVIVRRVAAGTIDRRASITQVDPQRNVLKRRGSIGKVLHVPQGVPMNADVILRRAHDKQSYGFSLATSDSGAQLVSNVEIHSPAHGTLMELDLIRTVNSKNVENVPNEDVVALITQGTEVTLGIQRQETQPLRSVSVPTGNPVRYTVELQRAEGQSYGFVLGSDLGNAKVVSSVMEGSPAHTKLKCGDEIETINGVPALPMHHDELVGVLQASSRIGLGLIRNMPAVNKDQRMSVHLQAGTQIARMSVQIDRGTMESSYGFGFGTSNEGNIKLVSEVTPGGVCDGKLCAGDEIQTINGLAAASLEHQDIFAMLKATTNVIFGIERRLQPQPQIAPQQETSNDSIGCTVRIVRGNGESLGFSLGESNSKEDGHQIIQVNPGSVADGVLFPLDRIVGINGVGCAHSSHAEVVTLLKSSLSLDIDIEHDPSFLPSKRVEVVIRKTAGSYGLELAQADDKTHRISNVLSTSPAMQQVLQGDVLVGINDAPTSGMSYEDVVGVFARSETIHMSIDRPQPVEPKMVAIRVQIFRNPQTGTFGFTVGQTREHQLVIESVDPKGPAGELRRMDIVSHINGAECMAMPSNDFGAHVQQSPNPLELMVGRQQTVANRGSRKSVVFTRPSAFARQVQAQAQAQAQAQTQQSIAFPTAGSQITTVDVVLRRDTKATSYGFGIGETPSGEFVITDARPGTLADGQLAKGDIVMMVNGQPPAGRTHADVVGMIGSSTEVHFVVQRGAVAADPSVLARRAGSIAMRQQSQNASSPVTGGTMVDVVVVRDSLQTSYGFGVGEVPNGDLVVTECRPGTPSAGRLAKGDILRALNGQPTAGCTHEKKFVGVIAAATEARFVVQRGVLDDAQFDASQIVRQAGSIALTGRNNGEMVERSGGA